MALYVRNRSTGKLERRSSRPIGGGSAFGGSPRYSGGGTAGSGTASDPYRKTSGSGSSKQSNTQTQTREDVAKQVGSEGFKELAAKKLSEEQKKSQPGSAVKENVTRRSTTVQVLASRQQETVTRPATEQAIQTRPMTPEEKRLQTQSEQLERRRAGMQKRIERGKDLYRGIPGLRGDNKFQRGAREFLFIINPGTSAPALGETFAAGIESSLFIRNYRKTYGKESTPSNTAIAKETGKQSFRVITFRDPQTGAFTPESVGASSALFIGGALGAKGRAGTTRTSTTEAGASTPRVRTISIFDEGGTPRATGDLPPGINYAEVAPRGVAPSARQAQQGVPVEFTYESIGGRTQYQTRLARAGDPAASVAKQLTTERFASIEATKRFVFDTAGRDPRQTQLGAAEIGRRTESGALINRIPSSEQVLAAANLRRGGAQGKQTVLDSFTQTPRRTPTAQEVIDAATPTTRELGFPSIRGRKAQVSIQRPSTARPNPNKLPFGIPGKGQLGTARPATPSIQRPQSIARSPRLITTFIGDNQRTPIAASTETTINQSVNFDKEIRRIDKQLPALKPSIEAIQQPKQDQPPITKPRSGTRSRTAQTPIQEPITIQDTKPAEKPPIPRTRLPARINTPQQRTQRPPVRPLALPKPKPLPGQNTRSEGFNVLVRRKGRFSIVNPQPLPKAQAIQFGAFRVGRTAAATFKIEQAGRPASGSFSQKGILKDFIKKGNLFIEKPSRRIKSIGELQQITFKGIAANKKPKPLKLSNPFKKIKLGGIKL